jgi:aminomethyltransferase
VKAIREGVALARPKGTFLIRFSGGDGAWDTLNHLSSSDLFLRDGQIIHTLWLAEDATPLGDVYVCRTDEEFLVIGESAGVDLVAHAKKNVRLGAIVDDLAPAYTPFSLHGPFAWELMAMLVGGGVVGVPYLSMFRLDGGGWGFRAGKTGEYGYDLFVPNEGAAAWEKRIREAGAKLDLGDATEDVLQQCRLENWFFDIRREGKKGLSPLELQLQWRTSSAKEYIGSAALAERRKRGIARRVLTMVAPSEMREGAEVRLFGASVGEVLAAGKSEERNDWVALALVDVAWSHAGIDAFEIGGVPARSITPPVLDNRSLYVNPQTHTYASRAEAVFPPLAIGV